MTPTLSSFLFLQPHNKEKIIDCYYSKKFIGQKWLKGNIGQYEIKKKW